MKYVEAGLRVGNFQLSHFTGVVDSKHVLRFVGMLRPRECLNVLRGD